jgi:hypothetical protein
MNVEQLIADVAAEIVTSQLESGFSSRVRERIQIAERRARKIRAIGAVGMLVVLAGLGVLLARWTRADEAATSAVPMHASTEPIAPPGELAGVPSISKTATVAATPKTRRTTRADALPTAEQEWLARAVPALAPATPIAIEKPRTAESIQPASLQIPLMGVEAIGSDPLSIAPIGGSRH